ncbi:hypothetical protein [Nitrosomonas mobilis]|uniref:hypothetical protein n=1 Tax=Nitrosomonas mobilis TaxID=51642 RepID=UPI000B7F31E5|nr:hypothetical protein [Nitrosomonas mobilis]
MNKRESDAIGTVLHLPGQMVCGIGYRYAQHIDAAPESNFQRGCDGQQTGGVQDSCRREYIVFSIYYPT